MEEEITTGVAAERSFMRRREALTLAVNAKRYDDKTPEDIIKIAKVFDKYLRGEE